MEVQKIHDFPPNRSRRYPSSVLGDGIIASVQLSEEALKQQQQQQQQALTSTAAGSHTSSSGSTSSNANRATARRHRTHYHGKHASLANTTQHKNTNPNQAYVVDFG
jgi:hypothetical protein